jgi:hypothetical protein
MKGEFSEIKDPEENLKWNLHVLFNLFRSNSFGKQWYL